MRTGKVWWTVGAAVALAFGGVVMSMTSAVAGAPPVKSYQVGEQVSVSGTGCLFDGQPGTLGFWLQHKEAGPDPKGPMALVGTGQARADGSWSGFYVPGEVGDFWLFAQCTSPKIFEDPKIPSKVVLDPIPLIHVVGRDTRPAPTSTTIAPATSTTRPGGAPSTVPPKAVKATPLYTG